MLEINDFIIGLTATECTEYTDPSDTSCTACISDDTKCTYHRYEFIYKNKPDETQPYIEYEIPKTADMISDFDCNVKFSIIIGEDEYTVIDRVFLLCLDVDVTKIRILLTQPYKPDEIKFSWQHNIFSQTTRLTIKDNLNVEGGLRDVGAICYKGGRAYPPSQWGCLDTCPKIETI